MRGSPTFLGIDDPLPEDRRRPAGPEPTVFRAKTPMDATNRR